MPRGPVRDSDEVRREVVAAARGLMIERGVRAVRLRDVLKLSGASNGQLYGVFANLDEVILQVNAETLGRLEERLAACPRESGAVEQLVSLARSYLGFASEETALWRALFEYEPDDDGSAVTALREDQARLFEYAAAPLGTLYPELGETDLLLRARTLFSAVHGVVSISLESRYAGVTSERLEDELTGLVRAAVTGYGARPATR